MQRLIVGLVAAVVLIGAVCQAKGAVYSVTNLGDLPGGANSSEAFALNSSGQVVGISNNIHWIGQDSVAANKGEAL